MNEFAGDALFDEELERWRRTWQTQALPVVAIPDQIRRAVWWSTVRSGLVVLMELWWTAIHVMVTMSAVQRRPGAVTTVWAVGAGTFLVAAWTFALWNRRRMWLPAAQTTRAFVELSYRRALSKLRSVVFARYLLVAEIAFLVPWGFWEYRTDPVRFANHSALFLIRYGLIALYATLVAVWSVWYRRLALADLSALVPLRRSLGIEDDPRDVVV
jgi:hypothetical protein